MLINSTGMKVICAPDSFKESMTALQAAQAMQRGILSVMPDAQVDLCPIADGGDGTVDAMLAATNGQERTTTVTGPRGQPVEAQWGVLGDGKTAVIEMATACGMALLPAQQRDPTQTSTLGTGELIKAALDASASRILIGIGGSATNDGGTGCAQALGVRFFDGENPITAPMTGGQLTRITRIDMTGLDPRIAACEIIVACDVNNPLTGPNGAAHIYGPQKGADPDMVKMLDQALTHLSNLWQSQLNKDVNNIPGSGAAGGLGGGLLVFLNAKLQRGAEMVLNAANFAARAADCNYCFTGEGRLDGQSMSGKAVLTVANKAAQHNVPTIALVGSTGEQVEKTLDAGLAAYHVISNNLPLQEAIQRGPELLEKTTAQVFGDLSLPPES